MDNKVRRCDGCLRRLFSCSDKNQSLLNRFFKNPTSREAFQISVVSALATLLAFIVGLVVSGSSSSSATLGYALENLVDLVSSLVVIWRFYGEVADDELEKREKRASIGIALMIILLSICVFSVAVGHLGEKHAPKSIHDLIGLSVPSFLIFSFLGFVKWRISNQLRSPAMRKDAVCSLAGAILSLGVLIGAALFMNDDAIWWFDAFVAILISVCLFLYGLRTLVKNYVEGKAFWTLEFWRTAKNYKSVDESSDLDLDGIVLQDKADDVSSV
jgi:divalent metal cation (Fe/Co/Zn/Cd) transporter